MQATARMASVVSSTPPARRPLIRCVICGNKIQSMFALYEKLLLIERLLSTRSAAIEPHESSTGQNARQWFFSTLSRNLGYNRPALTKLSLSHIGLGLFENLDGDPSEEGYYWCTPINCRVFAYTGSGGTHFSFLSNEGFVDDTSPVIATLPSDLGCTVVVGENLLDFLCLGCLRGFYCIEQINHKPNHPLFNSQNFQPNERQARSGFETNEAKEAILNYLRDELSLKPWSDVTNRLAFLEEKYAELIQYPPQ